MQQAETPLGTAPEGKLVLQLAIPAMLAQFVNILYSVVDRMYVGHIAGSGADALAGVGVCAPVVTMITAFAALVGFGGGPLMSIRMGRRDMDGARQIVANSFYLLLALSALVTVPVLVFRRPILFAFGASEQLWPYAEAYFTTYVAGTVFALLSVGMNQIIMSQGFSGTAMRSVMLGAAVNIALDPVFIFLMDMGVRGAALATVLSQAVSSIWVVRFLTSERSFLRIRRACLRLRAQVVLPCVALGVSPFIMQFTESVLSVCFNTSLLKYGGDMAVGAMTILSSAMQFCMLPLQGLTQGAQPIVSFNYGARKMERVNRAFVLLLAACLSFSTLLWAVAMFAPQVYASIFTDDPALIAYSCDVMRVYMAASLLFGAQLACQQTFIALGNAKISVFLALLRKVILLIPLIFLLPPFFQDKVFAVFLAEPVADTIAVTVTVTMFFITFTRLKRAARAGA